MTRRMSKKEIGLMRKVTNNLLVHQTFLCIPLEFCLWLQRENILHNFLFYGGCKKAPTKFYFSFWTWITLLGIQLQKGCLHLKKYASWNDHNKDRKLWIHFFYLTFSLLPPSTHLKVPINIKDCLLTSKDNSRMQNKAQQWGNQWIELVTRTKLDLTH